MEAKRSTMRFSSAGSFIVLDATAHFVTRPSGAMEMDSTIVPSRSGWLRNPMEKL
jgi:hypothetical protein